MSPAQESADSKRIARQHGIEPLPWPHRANHVADLEHKAAIMRAKYLHHGSGCRSTARAIEQRTGRTA